MLGLLALGVHVPAFAQDAPPDALIRRLTDEVTTIIRSDRGIQAGDSARIVALVEEKVLPHVDFSRATQLALGAGWRQATPAQREALTAQFQRLLVRTYSGALASYRDQKIDVLPVRMRPGDAEATVHRQVRQSGQAPIAIDYQMERADGGWKVFDITVDGMSLVLNYRSSFSEEIANHGIDGLIGALEAKNRS